MKNIIFLKNKAYLFYSNESAFTESSLPSQTTSWFLTFKYAGASIRWANLTLINKCDLLYAHDITGSKEK